VFGRFDEVCERHGALKIKTLGDGWLAVSGLPHARADHARAGAALARDMVAAVREVREVTGQRIGLRIGLASGPVVAGVIGRTRYAYDVWGATVREATAMEQGGAEDRIRLAPSTARALEPAEVVDEGGVFWLR
jgi:adenylate cyclase